MLDTCFQYLENGKLKRSTRTFPSQQTLGCEAKRWSFFVQFDHLDFVTRNFANSHIRSPVKNIWKLSVSGQLTLSICSITNAIILEFAQTIIQYSLGIISSLMMRFKTASTQCFGSYHEWLCLKNFKNLNKLDKQSTARRGESDLFSDSSIVPCWLAMFSCTFDFHI